MNKLRSNNFLESSWVWLILWLVVVLISLSLRPILPIDETRYLSVAWEMWLNDDYLVPHLNGNPYSHKPPLLFWIINAGWLVFGVNDIWPRLVAPLFGFGCLVVTSLIGKKISPHSSIHFTAPLFLIGALYWSLYMSLTMFDLILTFWTLTGMYGLLMTQTNSFLKGWVIFGFSLGLGTLSKGPVIFIFLLPCALFCPYWAKENYRFSWFSNYIGLLISLALGVIIALSWAIPAGQSGGIEYEEAILWGQSAGRVIQSFAHQKPIWWYLLIFPLVIFPWIIWPSLLKQIWISSNTFFLTKNIDSQSKYLRFISSWIIPPIILLSIISGKQPHYLFPILPAMAIGASLLVSKLSKTEMVSEKMDIAPVTTAATLLGFLILINPLILSEIGKSEFSKSLMQGWSLPLFIYALLIMWKTPQTILGKLHAICCFSITCVLTAHLILQPILYTAYDLKPIAMIIKKAQSKGYTIANMDKYHGQYNFVGRLTQPIVFTDSKLLEDWLNENPFSKVISYHYKSPERNNPEYFQRYRGRFIAFWDGHKIRNNPTVAYRGN